MNGHRLRPRAEQRRVEAPRELRIVVDHPEDVEEVLAPEVAADRGVDPDPQVELAPVRAPPRPAEAALVAHHSRDGHEWYQDGQHGEVQRDVPPALARAARHERAHGADPDRRVGEEELLAPGLAGVAREPARSTRDRGDRGLEGERGASHRRQPSRLRWPGITSPAITRSIRVCIPGLSLPACMSSMKHAIAFPKSKKSRCHDQR